jgi:hypothetical protein
MEAKDFRLGNLVKSVLTKKPYEIDLWALRVIQEGNYQNSYDTETKVFEPIRLTEDVLTKKFQFIKKGISKKSFCPIFSLNGINLEQSNSGNFYYRKKPILYVHKLQNLYYELKDEELKLKSK